jgi:hypothetical protein
VGPPKSTLFFARRKPAEEPTGASFALRKGNDREQHDNHN